MDKLKKEKLQRFLADRVMAEAVHSVLLDAFLKPIKYDDVGMLAASRLAVDFLHEAWKDLQKHKPKEETNGAPDSNVGL